VPELVAAHPLLAPHAHLVAQAHAAWADVEPDVRAARDADEWPEALFDAHAGRFHDLEQALFAVKDEIACRVDHDLWLHPERYLQPVGTPERRGVVRTTEVTEAGIWHLRFVDGFPVGPNVLEGPHGTALRTVTFSPDRSLIEVDEPIWFDTTGRRAWLHYPTMASTVMIFEQGRLVSVTGGRALRDRHGLAERFHADGRLASSELTLRGQRMLCERLDDEGRVAERTLRAEGGQEVVQTYWPDGTLNTRAVKLPDGGLGYLIVRDEDGTDLAPGGEGTLRQRQVNGRVRTGRLAGGLLVED
jgi:hypothetical protein